MSVEEQRTTGKVELKSGKVHIAVGDVEDALVLNVMALVKIAVAKSPNEIDDKLLPILETAINSAELSKEF